MELSFHFSCASLQNFLETARSQHSRYIPSTSKIDFSSVTCFKSPTGRMGCRAVPGLVGLFPSFSRLLACFLSFFLSFFLLMVFIFSITVDIRCSVNSFCRQIYMSLAAIWESVPLAPQMSLPGQTCSMLMQYVLSSTENLLSRGLRKNPFRFSSYKWNCQLFLIRAYRWESLLLDTWIS